MMSKKQLLLAVGSAAILGAGQASAVLVHEWNFDNGTANDSVGTAHLDLMGAASIAGGRLVLTNTGGAPRTENATAGAASVAELAATINGTDELSIVIKYDTTVSQNWSKVLMTGTGGDSWLDITPRRDTQGGILGSAFNDGINGESVVVGPPAPAIDAAGPETVVVATWTEGGFATLDFVEVGNPESHQHVRKAMGALDFANLIVSEFYLGSAVGFGDQDFNGSIDYVQMYNNAFSREEIYGALSLYTADTDLDGDVDDFDLINAIVNYTGSLSVPSPSVPEPASVALLSLGGLLLGRRRRS